MSTNRFAVLGSPVDHSKSPLLHNAAYQYLGLSGQYTRTEVIKGQLGAFLGTHGDEYEGFSITMPLKHEAYECATHRTDIVERIRVANTLIRQGTQWHASNTDVLGFLHILRRNFASHLERPIILGSGSTAKSAILALNMLGVSSIRLMARRESAADDIASYFPEMEISYLPWQGAVSNVSLVISAVPEVIGIKFDESVTKFIDVTYANGSQLKDLISANSPTYINGLYLLVYQAAFQVLAMRSIPEDRFEDIVEAMFRALKQSN